MTKLFDEDVGLHGEITLRLVERLDAQLRRAYRLGYQRAIHALRDHDAFLDWLRDNAPRRTVNQSELASLYLEAAYPESTVSFNDPSSEAGKEQPDD